MPISITVPEQLEIMKLYEFCTSKYSVKFPPTVSMAYEEAKAFNINGMLLVLWACIRSEGFTSKEYKENTDIFRLGGKYAKYRDAFACGASELAKFTSTEQLQEQEAVEKLWAEAWAWSEEQPPVVVPPKPPQKPVEPPKPSEPDTSIPPNDEKPSEPENDKQKGSWNFKKIAAWVAGIATALGVITPFIPGIYDDIIVKAIKIIADLVSNM
jgi:hypothetical protein